MAGILVRHIIFERFHLKRTSGTRLEIKARHLDVLAPANADVSHQRGWADNEAAKERYPGVTTVSCVPGE